MYTHKKCGKEVCVKQTVHEYCKLDEFGKDVFIQGDVIDSDVTDSFVWCLFCGKKVPHKDVVDTKE